MVSVNENIGGNGENPYIHWLDDTHKVTISTVPGVQLINADTNEVINSGNYMCETSFNYKVKIEEGYNYPDLKLIEINNDDTENFKSVDVNTSEVYTFDRLIRTRAIYVQNLSAGVDLSLRTFITEVNRASVEQSRAPVTNLVNGSFEYLHTKYPVIVKTLGLVSGAVYKILDKNKNPISGLENVSLDTGTLTLKTVDIETLGIDTYYIKEITPASGYEKLIKLNVRRYWDSGTERFKISIETENLTDDALNQDVPDTTEFKDCTNTGVIEAKK